MFTDDALSKARGSGEKKRSDIRDAGLNWTYHINCLGDLYISSIDNAIKKEKTAAVVMDDIITTKGRIFMEGRRQPVGRLRGRRAKSKNGRIASQSYTIGSFICVRREVLRVLLLTRLRKLLAKQIQDASLRTRFGAPPHTRECAMAASRKIYTRNLWA